MEKNNNFWLGLTMFLVGIVVGFFIAPIKKGVNVKNICGNQMSPDDIDYMNNCDDCGYDEIKDDENGEDLAF